MKLSQLAHTYLLQCIASDPGYIADLLPLSSLLHNRFQVPTDKSPETLQKYGDVLEKVNGEIVAIMAEILTE